MIVQGPAPTGSEAIGNPLVQGGVDGNGNIQPLSCNQDIVLLASAARTTATASPAQLNQNGRGVVVYLNVTAASGTGGLTIQFQALDPASQNWLTLGGATTAVTATGLKGYVLYPPLNNFLTQAIAGVLPRTWRINVAVGDSSSYTYSVGASLIL